MNLRPPGYEPDELPDCSTPRRNLMNIWSGKRGSNPRHSAWKADALPTELFPPVNGLARKVVERGGFEPPNPFGNRFTVCRL